MNFKTYLLIFSFCTFCSFSQAQLVKQPISGKGSLGIKIDGKLDDWKTYSFQYDKKIRLSYALANDEKYLYLAIRKDKNARKINRGLSFILVDDKKKEMNFTYPTIESGNMEQNLIRVSGIPSIQDSTISVYNEYGINAAMVIGTEAAVPVYTMEFAIPFKILREGISARAKELNFIIRLMGDNDNAGAALISSSKMDDQSLISKEDVIDLLVVTELKGIYQIAVKTN